MILSSPTYEAVNTTKDLHTIKNISYTIVSHSQNHFRLQLRGRVWWIPIDCLVLSTMRFTIELKYIISGYESCVMKNPITMCVHDLQTYYYRFSVSLYFHYILFVSASLFNLYLFLKGTTRTEAKRKQIKPETKRKHDTVWYVY